ncbi:hypothetical protein QBC43DRAFT_70725 [Cladorrhinum sp. PSN259]|nr:hypothetical protein QBC43DRAFT_70725 [Cladorrhinum sp. PSN259]
MQHHDRRISKIAKGSRLLAKKHSRDQIAYWRLAIQRHVISSYREMAQVLAKQFSESSRSLSELRNIVTSSLDESTAQEVCESFPAKELFVSKGYRVCGVYVEKEFGVSIVPNRVWIPAGASIITIPSDVDDANIPPSPETVDDTDEDDLELVIPAQSTERSLPASPVAANTTSPAKRRCVHVEIPDTDSESSYQPSRCSSPELES